MNAFLNRMIEKWGRNESLTPHCISWNLAPKINAVQRSDDMEAKKLLIKAFLGEEDVDEAIKVASRLHREQTNKTKKIFDKLNESIDCSHKVLIGFGEKEDKNYLGLAANKLLGEYNKPAIVLREATPTKWSGSIRSTVPLAEEITKTKLATCQGHSEAAGIFLQKSNLERLIAWLDTLDLSITPDVPVTGILNNKQVSVELAEVVDEWKILWGEGLPKPTWSMDVYVDPRYVNIYEKKTTTIKAFYKGLDFLLFFAKDKDVKAFSKGGKFRVIFEIGINEWNGVKKAQCIISKYDEIVEDEDDDWRNSF